MQTNARCVCRCVSFFFHPHKREKPGKLRLLQWFRIFGTESSDLHDLLFGFVQRVVRVFFAAFAIIVLDDDCRFHHPERLQSKIQYFGD